MHKTFDGVHPVDTTYADMGNYIYANMFGDVKSLKKWKPISVISPATVSSLVPKYCIDDNGYVHFSGKISVGSNYLVATLPLEIRPSYTLTTFAMAVTGIVTYANIFTTGDLSVGVINNTYMASVPPYYVGIEI